MSEYVKKINFGSSTVLLIYYMLFSLSILFMAKNNPTLNWDMIGYVASAKHFEISDPIELHDYVFENLKSYVNEDKFFDLTDGNIQYRIDMATEPELFYQQLPFYEIRPIYTINSSYLYY